LTRLEADRCAKVRPSNPLIRTRGKRLKGTSASVPGVWLRSLLESH
jgi:hypothetical protein